MCISVCLLEQRKPFQNVIYLYRKEEQFLPFKSQQLLKRQAKQNGRVASLDGVYVMSKIKLFPMPWLASF